MWEEPNLARFLTRLASFSRLILFDKRGVGLSDRVPDDRLPPLEVRMDDVRSVMDDVGSERAIVFGNADGGPMAIVFAATYPERTIGLILYGTVGDYGDRDPSDAFVAEGDEYLDYIDRNWGTLEHAREEIRRWGAPSDSDDERLVAWLASYLRRSASPGAAVSLARMSRQINAQHALPAIHVPTLVLAKSDDRVLPVERPRAMAESIVGARFAELPGDNRFFWVGDQSKMLEEIERFASTFRDEEAELQRFLSTVLFTDIVGSTEHASQLGDIRWKELVEAHHARVRGQLARYRGGEIDTAGDGFFASFDGPARAVHCALAISESVKPLGIDVRAGLHTGEVEQIGGKVAGIAVNIGARVAGHAGPSEVWVSQTVKDLVAGSGLAFEDAGEHELKGIPDRWRLYRVID
jgi:class 3 adenylate cyclase